MTQIGFHISKKLSESGFSQDLESYINQGVNAFQVCLSSPDKTNKGNKLNTHQIYKIKNLCENNKIYGVVHGKFIYNFCRENCDYQIDLLVQELELSNDVGFDLILHQGKNVDDEGLMRIQAINNYVKHLSQALENTFDLDNSILLENSSKQGKELGYSLEELCYIYKLFPDHLKSRVGFCIDLCHVFVSGELDMRKSDDVHNFFAKFDSFIGLNKLKCIHFNDSKIPFNGCNDKHGDLYCGYITNPLLGGSIEGMKTISQLAKKNNIPIIFETPCDFNSLHKESQITWQMKIVKDWSNKNNDVYLEYLNTYPDLSLLSYNEITSKNTKKPKFAKTQDIHINIQDSVNGNAICNCDHNKKQTQTQKKIPIKLKNNI